jgi:tRNA/rRNA methyltransferase
LNNKPAIILVSPQLGENIGMSARAMKNFGFSDLRIISPRDGWPNIDAINSSVGAVDLINNAKIFSSIQDAICDLEYIYATTASTRSMNKRCIELSHLQEEPKKLGILFGRENSGLTNNEISFSNKILFIETEDDFSSLNLSHAVALACYKISRIYETHKIFSTQYEESATCQDLNHYLNYLEKTLDKTNFFKISEKRELMIRNIRNIFTKIDDLSKTEINILYGIIKALDKE